MSSAYDPDNVEFIRSGPCVTPSPSTPICEATIDQLAKELLDRSEAGLLSLLLKDHDKENEINAVSFSGGRMGDLYVCDALCSKEVDRRAREDDDEEEDGD